MRMLDLFCKEGIGARGYEMSGFFTEIIGVDIENMSRYYPYKFIQADAMTLDYEFLMSFDFIHASPPCQAYSKMTPEHARPRHKRLVAATHTMLVAAGAPYVIENVEGSGAELRPNLILSGHDVGLNFERRRLFHVHSNNEFRIDKTAWNSYEKLPGTHVNGQDYVSKSSLSKLFAMDETIGYSERRFTRRGIEEGIPPRMTLAIARALFSTARG